MFWRMTNSMEPFLMMSDYTHVTRIQNGHNFHTQIAKIEHNLIGLNDK